MSPASARADAVIRQFPRGTMIVPHQVAWRARAHVGVAVAALRRAWRAGTVRRAALAARSASTWERL